MKLGPKIVRVFPGYLCLKICYVQECNNILILKIIIAEEFIACGVLKISEINWLVLKDIYRNRIINSTVFISK